MVGTEDVNEEEEKSDIPYGEGEKKASVLSDMKCFFLAADGGSSLCRSLPLQGHF